VGGSIDEDKKFGAAEGNTKKTGWKVQRELVRCSGQDGKRNVEMKEVLKVVRGQSRRIEDARVTGLVCSAVEETGPV